MWELKSKAHATNASERKHFIRGVVINARKKKWAEIRNLQLERSIFNRWANRIIASVAALRLIQAIASIAGVRI